MQGVRGSAGWLNSPFYDILFFSGGWLFFAILTILCASRDLPVLGIGLVVVIYHLGPRLPHFLSTAYITYFNKGNLQFYREHWVIYGVIPLSILVVYGMSGNAILQAFAVIWGSWHISYQNYGFLRLYQAKKGIRPDRCQQLLLKATFNAVLVIAILQAQMPALDWPVLIGQSFWWLPLALAALYLCYLAVGRKVTRDSLPELCFFAASLCATVRWPIYQSFGRSVGNLMYFYVHNSHHCLSYLGLMYLLDGKAKSGWGVSKAVKFTGPLLIGSALLLWFSSGWLPLLSLESVRSFNFSHLRVLTGVFVVHYYLESVSWKLSNPKLSNPHFRKVMLAPLLKPA